MKRIVFLCTIFLLCFISGTLRAQLSNQFPAELKNLITLPVSELKGKELERQQVAAIYEVKQQLTGFSLSYTQSIMGSSLSGKYTQQGSQEIMDVISGKLLETVYTFKDSNTQPAMLKGIVNSNVSRRIDVLDFSNNGKKVAVFTLYKDNNLLVEILNK